MIWQTLKSLFVSDDAAAVPFREEWIALLEQNLPLYRRLDAELRGLLQQRIGQFMATVRFEGCGDLELDDEMVLTVAAQACLLVLHREGTPYPMLQVVYLYPSTFSSVMRQVDELGIVTEEKMHRLGESWSSGSVVLAWDAVAHGAKNIGDAGNVTFHEFAHQLDHEDGPTDGAPGLPSGAAYRSWARVFEENYADFLELVEQGKEKVLNSYGATNPAEFFAVTTEAFFEKPRQLLKHWPDLYEQLRNYYRLHPAEWV
jgi:Mlc titration factor MtfA (ptsG expression regulator)